MRFDTRSTLLAALLAVTIPSAIASPSKSYCKYNCSPSQVYDAFCAPAHLSDTNNFCRKVLNRPATTTLTKTSTVYATKYHTVTSKKTKAVTATTVTKTNTKYNTVTGQETSIATQIDDVTVTDTTTDLVTITSEVTQTLQVVATSNVMDTITITNTETGTASLTVTVTSTTYTQPPLRKMKKRIPAAFATESEAEKEATIVERSYSYAFKIPSYIPQDISPYRVTSACKKLNPCMSTKTVTSKKTVTRNSTKTVLTTTTLKAATVTKTSTKTVNVAKTNTVAQTVYQTATFTDTTITTITAATETETISTDTLVTGTETVTVGTDTATATVTESVTETMTQTATQTLACSTGIVICDLAVPNSCCSGRCVQFFANPNCCVNSGEPCDIFHPEGCCSGTYLRQNASNLVIGKYEGIGTQHYLLEGTYKDLANTILDELAVGDKPWIVTWHDLRSEGYLVGRLKWIDAKAEKPPNRRRSGEAKEKHSGNHQNYSARSSLQPRAVVKDTGNTPYDVRYLATPPPRDGTTPDTIVTTTDYYYKDSQGRGVDIFVFDHGFEIKTTHSELQDAINRGQIHGYIFPDTLNPATEQKEYGPEAQKIYHGTFVTSKIIGKRGGLAKNARVWIVVGLDKFGNWIDIGNIDAMFKIRDKVIEETKKNPNYRAIINFSQGFTHLRDPPELEQDKYKKAPILGRHDLEYIHWITILFDRALKSLLELDNVALVTGAGNDDLGRPIIDWPAKRGASYDNLVVIGSVDDRGELIFNSKADFVKVYTMVLGIEIPDIKSRESDDGDEFDKLSCYFGDPCDPSLGKSELVAIKKLISDAYPRRKDGLKIAWTGVRPPPRTKTQKSRKRLRPSTKSEAGGSSNCKVPRKKAKGGNRKRQNMARRQETSESEDCDDDEFEEGVDGDDPNEFDSPQDPPGDFISTRTVLQVYKTRTEVRTVDVTVTATTLMTRATGN
ncbi:hypothetical protein H072_10197 [Dactylellina haptotyla CBS 200.50]|uniref:Peptidase S8/S53 domain-containing protein n=1 Tax=Dactylellina haptotyla (strain CBS 200.50) TaxID=1284197 RepID=S8A5A8_DACHA|nr:hypothetical protein H072_10197 [Dactylellina haptotyla CBS 200.50]